MADMCSILLAEDDVDDRMMIRRALKQAGKDENVHEFSDGVELMEYLGQGEDEAPWRNGRTPTLILLDLNMPRMSGRQVLQEIKADPKLKTIPVVVLTTSSSKIDVMESYEAGANAYVTKPHSYSELAEVARGFVHFWCKSASLPT
jgi:two-component system, response regulator